MTARHISDARQRRSHKYIALHAQLRKEAREVRKPSLKSRSSKQIRKFARSELFVLAGE